MVDDVRASVMPGVVRALAMARPMTIRGNDLFGAQQELTARVCEVGPFLVLNYAHFLHRQEGKDAFDFLYTILHYDGGTEAAVMAFAEESKTSNPAFPDARRALSKPCSPTRTLRGRSEQPISSSGKLILPIQTTSKHAGDRCNRTLKVRRLLCLKQSPTDA